jgi:hypothetical protein
MKQKLMLLFFAIFLINQTNAQLLKKLKDKAVKALEPKKETKVTETNNENNNEPVSGGNEKTTNKKQQKPDTLACKVIGQLGDGETFLYDETSVIAQNNTVSYSFVIVDKNYQYFLIQDGKRTGPFKDAPIKSAKQYSEDGETNDYKDEKVTIGNDDRDPIAIKYTKTIGGKLFIVFNGKNYGPYDYVAKMLVSNDKKHFFAMVTIGGENAMTNKMGMGNTFLVSDGTLKLKIATGTSMPIKFSVSDGFKQCKGTVMDSKTQKVTTVTSTGKQEEGNMADMYNDKNISLVNDNGDIVTVPAASPTQILVNGNEVASFKVPIKRKNNLFLLPDVSKSVYYQKGKIYRADGTEETLTGVVFPKVVTINKVTSLYYYKVYKNENGIREIYLCKKDL